MWPALNWSSLSGEGPLCDVPENIDYDFAQQELMLQQMEDDPIQVAIRSIEKQHEEDKQGELFMTAFYAAFITGIILLFF